MQQGNEPSLEEILASIRTTMMAREDTARESGAAEDVLELGEADMVARPDAAGPPGAAPDAGADGARLTGPNAAAAVRASLAALDLLGRAGPVPPPAPPADAALDALARALLRPMLADWLDRNLPPIVERMVAAEIARIVGRRD
ncbi:MAG: DUF2497 domain-containing protein [Porphyrobacter sp.]|nr:DUF2497 domain-containing protein [Porphyrobacter sp.]